MGYSRQGRTALRPQEGAAMIDRRSQLMCFAFFLSDLVLSPMLFLGGALLYLDQAARVVGSARAALHPPVDAHPAGRHDAQVEP